MILSHPALCCFTFNLFFSPPQIFPVLNKEEAETLTIAELAPLI